VSPRPYISLSTSCPSVRPAIFIAGLLSVLIIPNYGFGRAVQCFGKTVHQLRFRIVTFAMILGLAYIMNYSGMSSSMELAFSKTGVHLPFFSPILGWLGVLPHGLQHIIQRPVRVPEKDHCDPDRGVDPALTVAADSSGGVTGKMISPQIISVAMAAANLVGAGSTHLPVHSVAQRFHGPDHRRSDIPAGLRAQMDAAVELVWEFPAAIRRRNLGGDTPRPCTRERDLIRRGGVHPRPEHPGIGNSQTGPQ
jgi:hypothetical protein